MNRNYKVSVYYRKEDEYGLKFTSFIVVANSIGEAVDFAASYFRGCFPDKEWIEIKASRIEVIGDTGVIGTLK